MGRWLEWQTGCCKADTWKKIKLGEALKQARMQVLHAFKQRHSAGDGQRVQGWGKQREVTLGAARLWEVSRLILTHTSLARQKAVLMRAQAPEWKHQDWGVLGNQVDVSASLLFRKLERLSRGIPASYKA